MELTLQCPKCGGQCIMRTVQRVQFDIVIFGKCYDCDIPLRWSVRHMETELFPEMQVAH